MNQLRTILSIYISLHVLTVSGQTKSKIDTAQYHLAETIKQHGCVFKFWKGSTDATRYEVILEKISKNKDTITSMEPGMNGKYRMSDKNNDGYKDFVTNYHGHDIIYLFNSSTNLFQDYPVFTSEITGIVDSTKNIFWDLNEPMYSTTHCFSILYKYNGYKIEDLYELDFITKEDYAEKKDASRIELYKLDGTDDYNKKRFIKVIKTSHPGNFDYKLYWKKNYKMLLGY